jgi:hypothetical protein
MNTQQEKTRAHQYASFLPLLPFPDRFLRRGLYFIGSGDSLARSEMKIQYLPKVPTTVELLQISTDLADFFSVCVSHRMLITTKVSPRFSEIWPRYDRDTIDANYFCPIHDIS